MIKKTHHHSETIELGKWLGDKVKNQKSVILLEGDLGAGKTTFTKGIALGYGVTRNISSPTFTIMKSYQVEEKQMHHLDLYRLDAHTEDYDLEEYIQEGDLVVIEWPNQAPQLIPSEYIKVELTYLGDENREIKITSVGKSYEKLGL